MEILLDHKFKKKFHQSNNDVYMYKIKRKCV